MRPAILIAALAATVVGAFALWPRTSEPAASDPCGQVSARPASIGSDAAAYSTVCLINRERTKRGLPALKENPLLTAASVEHSRDMVTRDYFEHASPDGRSVADRLRGVGYRNGFSASAGENIAWGVGDRSTPASIVRAWMHSPGHRADILRPAFTEIGIGVVLGAPEVTPAERSSAATYTTDFGGVVDPSLPND